MKAVLDFQPLRRVFVFSISLRIFHWINALSITVLAITGLIIANPPALQQGHEASFGYWFGTLRFIHFAAAYIFTAGFVFRMYLMFNGNHFERWRNFIPTGKAYFKDFWQVVKIDVLLKKNTLHFAIGHNALAGFSYLVLFITMLVMIITGFALYSDMSMSWFPKLFTWVTQLLGGDIMVRSIHHIATWIFILFTIVHVYLVFFHDYVEGRGEISSMGGGWKFVSAELLDKHLNEKK